MGSEGRVAAATDEAAWAVSLAGLALNTACGAANRLARATGSRAGPASGTRANQLAGPAAGGALNSPGAHSLACRAASGVCTLSCSG